MKGSVLILLASYNGEKYIAGQIDSIIRQDYQNWNLIIRDDGSTDATVEIVREYCKKDERIRLIQNETDAHGAFLNFHALIAYTRELPKYAYYMFCDQDDVWKEDKISSQVELIGEDSRPVLVYGDMDVIDENGNILHESMDRLMDIEIKNRWSGFFCHSVWGCNILFNRALYELVPGFSLEDDRIHILSHDNYYTKFALMYGRVLFCRKVLMSYRRHGGNATSKHSYKISLGAICRRIFQLSDLAGDHARTYNQSLLTIQYMKKISPDNREISDIHKVILTGGIRSVMACLKHGVSWGKPVRTVSRLFILLTGWYKKFLV